MSLADNEIQLKQKQRAIYNSPENFFNWSWPAVPRHQFLDERNKAYDPDEETGLIELDISKVLETPYPATIPAILHCGSDFGLHFRVCAVRIMTERLLP